MRSLTWSLLAAGLILAGSGTSQAQDTVRLGGPAAQSDIDGGADVAFVGWGRGGYYGGYRGGYYGGYRGCYGYGYRSYYAGYGYGFYRPYYRGYYGYGYGYYPPVYYYQPYVYYNAPSYYYPIAGTAMPTPTVQTRASYSEPLPSPGGFAPMPPANNGTFPYDGGPRSPVPQPAPGDEYSPAKELRSLVPIDGKLVSLPNAATMGSVLLTTMPDVQPRRNATTTPAPRSGYAAYGEDPITAPVRKR